MLRNDLSFNPRLCLMLGILFIGSVLHASEEKTGKNNKPNFILVLVDDMGWMDLSCQGSTFYETPHIDGLAKDGMRFTNAYAACAVCSPSRAAVMTGRYPARTGITDWIRARFQRKAKIVTQNPTEWVSGKNRKLLCPPNPYWMEHREITIPEALEGYTSCHIGKWHLGDDDWYPTNQGFDLNIGGCDYGQPPSFFDPYTNKRLKQGIPFLPARKEGEYLTDREGDEAAKFILNNKDNPFFIYMAHYAVHTPIQGKKDLIDRYSGKPDATKKHQNSAAYAAMVHSVDDAMGKMLAALKEAGIEDQTMIIFTSDNGGLLRKNCTNNHPLRSGKGYAYEGGVRVPLIVKWPGKVPAEKVSSEPITGVDYFPTIIEAAGQTPVNHAIDGISILPHLTSGGKTKLDRKALFWHFPHYRHNPGPYSIIRQGDFKLIRFYEGPTYELYNLEQDLGENQNLASQMPEKVKTLDARLMAHLRSVNAKIPKPNPAAK